MIGATGLAFLERQTQQDGDVVAVAAGPARGAVTHVNGRGGAALIVLAVLTLALALALGVMVGVDQHASQSAVTFGVDGGCEADHNSADVLFFR